jgi:hypothetical protein
MKAPSVPAVSGRGPGSRRARRAALARRPSPAAARARRAALALLPLVAAGRARPARADASKLPPEVGWNYGEMETARTAALGGAVRAFGAGTAAMFYNPANLAAARDYVVEGTGQVWPEARRQSYGAAIADARINPNLAGGVAANYTWQDNDGLGRKALDVRVGLAVPVSDKFFLGATGRYARALQSGLGPLGRSFASGGRRDDPLVDQFTFDAGLAIRPTDSIALGLLGTNLTVPGHGFLPTTLGGGIGVGVMDALTLEGDALVDFTTYDRSTWRAGAGGEFVVADHFPLRLGYRFDEGQESHAIGGGAGYRDAQFGFDVAVRRTIAGEAATTVVFGLQFLLETPSPATKAPNSRLAGLGP